MSFKELDAYINDSINRSKNYINNDRLTSLSKDLMQSLINEEYVYNFYWCGVPIIQFPQDLIALQEIIWNVKPDCIIETGIAWGGSLLFSASMLAILEVCGAIKNPKVIGIDIDIRNHNRKNLELHPLKSKIELVEGSSTDEKIFNYVDNYTKKFKRRLVILDSNHCYNHVLQELKLYTQLVTIGSYCIVNDTFVEDFQNSPHLDRPWGRGNNPKIAVHDFLKYNKNFIIDNEIENKLLLTCAPDGFLKKI